MNITNEHEVTIYRFDGEYGATYSVGLSKKKQDGSYKNGYISCKFKKGVDIQNKTKLFIKSAWLSFNLKDKKTVPYIFINEYKTLDEAINPPKESKESVKLEDIQITNEDLPF